MASSSLHVDSAAVHAGRDDLAGLGVHALPIDLSSTNPLPDVELGGHSYEVLAGGGHPPADGSSVYARLWNPTVARFEKGLARLEGGADAVAFASGMAAVTAALLTLTSAHRRHIVAVRPLYGGTDHLLASGLLGTTTTFCAPERIASSVRTDTAAVFLETPANPTLELVDIADAVAQADGVPVVVDNTFATPVLQRPLAHGAAMSLHSATKYIGGHGDAVGGVIACDDDLATALRRTRAITGGILHPMAAYLLHRGLPTLPTRVRVQQSTAHEVAAWLTTHPAVERVHHPSLPGADPSGLIGRQMHGPGAMIGVVLTGGFPVAAALTTAVSLFTHAVSLGGVDSLIQHPAALTHRPVTAEARPSEALVRLSIGLENAADLIADLDRALSGAARQVPSPAGAGTRVRP
ncbi:trans-sulfuration enzyme family protein [Microbacterium xanthum]|uniref:trans-sulfuration enzyme family protein n=1 Tax=Microbacterium xanthum TaxID=3079794 RepID=UPI002AD362D1|nr:PLP-dependent aspartate aminotransferase family protein [Microbacterium sp. KSW-48]MDZ8172498.1 PLP-dependent aspartate aminotransferase family protein [Microbacterium sp. KSW-48]